MPRRARLSSTSVAVAAVVVALATFGLGFGLSYDPGETVELADDQVAVTTTVDAVPTVPTTGATTTTTNAPDTTTTSSVPMTVAPTVATTAVPTTAPPPPTSAPVGPGRIEVSFPRDEGGRMLLVAGGAAAIIVRNTGGSEISFSVEGAGAVTVGATGVANGVLRPGEGRAIPVVAGIDPPAGPGPHATIAVFSSTGLIRSIPVVIA
jgi:hypothetical protein